MTRVFLAAGVAALAITAPANAGPKQDRQAARAERQQAQPRQQVQAVRQQAPRMERQMAAPRMERQMAAPRMERVQRMTAVERPQRAERVQMRAERQAARPAPAERVQTRVAAQRPARIERQQARAQRIAPVQTRQAARQQVREARVQPAQTRQAERQQIRADRQAQAQARTQTMQAQRQQVRSNQIAPAQTLQADRQQLRADRQAARVQLRADNVARVQALAANRAAIAPVRTLGTTVLPVTTAQTLIGVPVATAATIAAFNPLPQNVQYLYPDTPDYYYRYGDGYLYQVDRSSNLIAALLPLLAGGYMPGSYLPNYYMNSYAPDYWGLNSFYPSSYSGYGYGYGYDNLCNRYANGVIYQVDCMTGLVQNVIPTYAGGYGVGQLLPTDYSYYNVPYQYRSMYYDTPDYNYWYAPGAIYQYDPGSSMITSVAALLSPGFTVGQPLPMGYSTYNVPYAYRSTYYDTPNAWYRYNNGYIYQVDPTTQLVSAIVASILT
jgi:hypothetical protein